VPLTFLTFFTCILSTRSVYSPSEFEQLFAATYNWVNDTQVRCPLSDWYFTDPPARSRGFEARSMWGGIYSRLFWQASS
jgi:hypothetical protein